MVTLMWNYLYKNGVNSVQVCHVTRWASILACSARYFICLRSIDVSDFFLLVAFSLCFRGFHFVSATTAQWSR